MGASQVICLLQHAREDSLVADVLEDVVRFLIEDGIRAVGLVVLKVVTFGRYKSAGQSALLVEGAIGLLTIAAVLISILWWVW